ncbi:MAG: ATP-binding protein, partial [Thermaerobacter sp.]|nr:ATP-binding protein [Thermaerobacter sp.]
GARLHPSLTRFILNLFHSLDINLSTAQLICNTHDVLLLDEDIRRDQVWFVQKNQRGESELYSLHDFADIRKDDLFRKKYLLGVFGAIPRLERNAAYE